MIKQEYLLKAVTMMAWWIVLAIPPVLIVWFLTARAIKEERLPSDTSVSEILMDVFLTWPKVYYVAFITALARGSTKLMDKVVPPETRLPDEIPKQEDGTAQILALVERRMNDNKDLAAWMFMEGEANDKGMGFSIGKTAGVTYLTIFEEPRTLMRAMYADGSFPVQTMDCLDSLHPWMVFDLVTEHPELTKVFPPRILSKLNVELH